MKYTIILTFFVLLLAACAPAQNSDQSSIMPAETALVPTSELPVCDLPPITIPTLPDVIPGYAQLDETTGLHVTGTAPDIDFSAYHLSITGLVENPVSFTYDQLRCFPKVTANPELSCRGYFVDTANWSGALISDILAQAQPLPEAKTVTLISADGYEAEIPLSVAMDGECFLAYELEGETLPILHGFPLRAVIPTREGLYWVKWLVELNIH